MIDEQQEIARLKDEVAGNELTVAQLESEIHELEGEINEFRQRYEQQVGFAASRVQAARELLAQLEAERAAAEADTPPHGSRPLNFTPVEEQYRQKWGTPSSEPPQTLPEIDFPERSGDTKPNLKRLYRALARKYHPDFASDDEDRERRTQLMAVINESYQKGDLETLKLLQHTPAEEGEGDTKTPLAKLMLKQLQRLASALNLQVAVLQNRRNQLLNSDWMRLKLDEKLLRREGRDLLQETLTNFDREFDVLQRRIDQLRRSR